MSITLSNIRGLQSIKIMFFIPTYYPFPLKCLVSDLETMMAFPFNEGC